MADINGSAAAVEIQGRRSLLHSPKLLAMVLLALAMIAGGAGYWLLTPRLSAPPAKEQATEPPFYLELKPFVVSVANDAGTHILSSWG